MDTDLKQEYDEIFEGDEKANNILKLTSDAFTREPERILLKSIAFTQPVKLGRKQTMLGLTSTVKDMGVVNPIHVMTVDEESEDDNYKYILLDGVRRVYGALKNGHTEIDAIVWDFKDKEKGMDLALVLSLVLNRVQKRSWGEIWDLYKILEMQNSFTPGALEYLLQLEGGDAMKLKDVMLCEYEEVKQALLNGEKNLESCYKMLQKLRKEEDALMKEDVMGVSDIVEDAEEISGDNDEGQLSDEDVRELLEMTEDLDNLDDLGEDDFDALNKVDDSFIDQQKVGDRHPLDPALRQAVLQKDNFTCQCCGMKMLGARLGLIAVHHKLPVHVGGKDTLDNLTTLDVGCHVLLHIMERNGGSILMSKEDFEKLPENEQISIKKALKLARIAIEADKRRGLSKKDVQEATRGAISHPMPGTGLKENQEAYVRAKQSSKDE